MGRSADAWMEQQEAEKRVALERAEATFFAIPDALHENLAVTLAVQDVQNELRRENAALRDQVTELRHQIDLHNHPSAKWKERGYGFFLGILASVIASLIWWQLGKYFTVLT